MLDSLNKRVKFLNEVIEALQLKNTEAIHGRAEDIARKTEYREQFDYVVSRAVANLSTLSEYTLPFVKENGYFFSYKSVGAAEEIKKAEKAMNLLSGKVIETIEFALPDTDIKRNIIVIQKTKTISSKYPRKAGLPAKEPL